MNNPCAVKRYFDTEFEAERKATIQSHRYGVELIPYKCGNHWHLANKRVELRSRYREDSRSYCRACGVYMKPRQWSKHQTLSSHRNKKGTA